MPKISQYPAGNALHSTDKFVMVRGGVNMSILGNALLGMVQPGGRLTLTSGTPVTSADVTGATNIYYCPCKHNIIVLWNGTDWLPISFTEYTLALGILTSGRPYDVFAYLSGTSLAMEVLAWTNSTTRATGISLQDGRYCKTGDKTRLYIGSFYTTSTTETEDSTSKRYLWNMYNRVERFLQCMDTTNTWNYTTATWRPTNNGTVLGVGRFAVIVGLAEETLSATVSVGAANASGDVAVASGVGIDVTNANSAQLIGVSVGANASIVPAFYRGVLAAGFHFIQQLEISKAGSGTTAWYGNAGLAYWNHGMVGNLLM